MFRKGSGLILVSLLCLQCYVDSMNPEVVEDSMAYQHKDNTVQQRFVATITIDSSKTSSSNGSGCKDYETEYKRHYPNKKEEVIEVLPPAEVRMPDDQIPDIDNKADVVDANHSRVFCSPEMTDTILMTDSKLLFNSDCETTLETLSLPPQRLNVMHAQDAFPNNSLQPVQQYPESNNPEETMQQHPPKPTAAVANNSSVTVEGDDVDDEVDDEVGDVMVPQDASSSDKAVIIIPSNFLQPASGKYV